MYSHGMTFALSNSHLEMPTGLVDVLIAVKILKFFVMPMLPPVGVSDVQKYPY